MKTPISVNWCFGLVIALAFTSGCKQRASSSIASAAPTNNLQAQSTAPIQSVVAENPVIDNQTPVADLSDAPTQPISTEKPLPPNIKPTGPVSEIIKLADSGLE